MVGSKLFRSQVTQPGIFVSRTLFTPTAKPSRSSHQEGVKRAWMSVKTRPFITLPPISLSFETNLSVMVRPKLRMSQSMMPTDFQAGKPCEGLPCSVPGGGSPFRQSGRHDHVELRGDRVVPGEAETTETVYPLSIEHVEVHRPDVSMPAMLPRKAGNLGQLATCRSGNQGAGGRIVVHDALRDRELGSTGWIAPSILILYQLDFDRETRSPDAEDNAQDPALRCLWIQCVIATDEYRDLRVCLLVASVRRNACSNAIRAHCRIILEVQRRRGADMRRARIVKLLVEARLRPEQLADRRSAETFGP